MLHLYISVKFRAFGIDFFKYENTVPLAIAGYVPPDCVEMYRGHTILSERGVLIQLR